MQRESVITMLAKVHAPKSLDALQAYAVNMDEKALNNSLKWLDARGDNAVDASLIQLRQALVARELPQLQEVHPEWMLRVLSCETPRVVAILLRYVPSKQALYIMDRLPARIKDRMPSVVDAFSVPTPVVQTLRRQFEVHFSTLKNNTVTNTGFNELSALGYEELPKLMKDLGVHELALAFADADPLSIQALSKRLPDSEARRLQERIRQLDGVSKTLIRDAKFTILDIDTQAILPDQFLFEVGLRAFAKACVATDHDLIQALSLKLEPKVGEWLLAQATRKASGELGKMRRHIIMERVVVLSRAGILDAKWQLLEVGTRQVASDSLDLDESASSGASIDLASKSLS
ncbi:MAG: hypothetical protein COV45_07150 [Deltaproteobacteria bacterium CG11_big_fil_rev_8_21_14_0_20_47_16]|nr:MAG: hypothetical protein COV45_07150 [Deltaproteobacteria bacterium CG11_big_fil_rev_8_21_14_0_20_47_16]